MWTRRLLPLGLIALLTTSPQAQTLSNNSYGVPGLIDMPSAQMQPDGELTTTLALLSNDSGRVQLAFQIAPRLQGVFRYATLPDFLPVGDDIIRTYDRSFDLRLQLLRENDWRPDVTVGLQDFGGTSIFAGEYVVATKTLGDRWTVTGGIGWGRFGTRGGFTNPLGALDEAFETRPDFEPNGSGGDFSGDRLFRGDAALFAGVAYRATERLTLKAEYSSDSYDEEEARDIYEDRSPVNLGFDYAVRPGLAAGGYVLGGSEVGVQLTFALNPKRPPNGSGLDEAPLPVTLRPARAAAPELYTESWVANPAVIGASTDALAAALQETGLELVAYDLRGDRAELRLRNPRYRSQAQAVGRAARAMTATLPPSIETFVIVPETQTGLAGSAVILRRSDIEALEPRPNAADEALALAGLVDAATLRDGDLTFPEDAYPRFDWRIGPYTQTEFFDPDNPVRLDVGVQASARWEPLRGLVVAGAVNQLIVGNRDDATRESNSVLPRVRSESNQFVSDDPFIPRLTAAYYFRPGTSLYGRVSAGLLETQYGGVSTEVLWKPSGSPLAIGVEANRVRQRETDMRFGFQELDATTAFVSGYYDFGNGYVSQVDVGQYLAGDKGATFRLTRDFDNGWQVGAYATFTDVSSEEFGEGSFDKGITLRVPFGWLTGQPSRATGGLLIQPILRDGGARLRLGDRLYPQVRDLSAPDLTQEWGRFWR